MRQTSESTGYDIYSMEDKMIKSFFRELIRLDLCMAILDGYYSRIVGRSCLALKNAMWVHNGTIDLDNLGMVCVILFNFSDVDYKIEKGNRIVQLIIERYYLPKFVEVSEMSEWGVGGSEGGQSGFGSTGK